MFFNFLKKIKSIYEIIVKSVAFVLIVVLKIFYFIYPLPYFKDGISKLHDRYFRPNRDDMFKIMDKKHIREVMKETSILNEEECEKLKNTKYSNFFKESFDKDSYIHMFSTTITDSTKFFKQRLSPSLFLYKGNRYSFFSILLRISGLFFYFIVYVTFVCSRTPDEFFEKLHFFLHFFYDNEALYNMTELYGFLFTHIVVILTYYHITKGFVYIFNSKITKKISYLFKNVVSFFSIFIFIKISFVIIFNLCYLAPFYFKDSPLVTFIDFLDYIMFSPLFFIFEKLWEILTIFFS